MKAKGKISSWNDGKGFGFITPVNGGKRLFIHIKAFNSPGRRPKEGDIVTYTLSSDKQGRPCATGATISGDKPVSKSNKKINPSNYKNDNK